MSTREAATAASVSRRVHVGQRRVVPSSQAKVHPLSCGSRKKHCHFHLIASKDGSRYESHGLLVLAGLCNTAPPVPTHRPSSRSTPTSIQAIHHNNPPDSPPACNASTSGIPDSEETQSELECSCFAVPRDIHRTTLRVDMAGRGNGRESVGGSGQTVESRGRRGDSERWR